MVRQGLKFKWDSRDYTVIYVYMDGESAICKSDKDALQFSKEEIHQLLAADAMVFGEDWLD